MAIEDFIRPRLISPRYLYHNAPPVVVDNRNAIFVVEQQRSRTLIYQIPSAAKEAEGMSARYLGDIRLLLGHFAKHFQCPLSSIQPDDLRQYLNAMKIGLVAKGNRRRMLVVLFNFAKAQGWLRAKEETAADALGTYKISDATFRFTRLRKSPGC